MFILKVCDFITDCACKGGLWLLLAVLLGIPWSMIMTIILIFSDLFDSIKSDFSSLKEK